MKFFCGGIISMGSICNVFKVPYILYFAVNANLHLPFVCPFIQTYALKTRCITLRFAAISHVFGVAAWAKVVASVVNAVLVLMVNKCFRVCKPKNLAVHHN